MRTTSPTDPILAHQPLVESVASAIAAEARSRNYGVEYDDLFQEGMLAVCIAGPEAELSEGAEHALEEWITARMRKYVADSGRQSGRMKPRPSRSKKRGS